jgi:hypothetical protein
LRVPGFIELLPPNPWKELFGLPFGSDADAFVDHVEFLFQSDGH